MTIPFDEDHTLVMPTLENADIRVPHDELFDALIEAHRIVASQNLRLTSYRARDIRNLKTTFGL